jgi:hypothetical protein
LLLRETRTRISEKGTRALDSLAFVLVRSKKADDLSKRSNVIKQTQSFLQHL